ncbi:MAG: hypothetical protein ABIF77_10500 [bacterium]
MLTWRKKEKIKNLWRGHQLLVLGLCSVMAAGCLLLLAGCEEECVTCLSDTPPVVPTGVYSVTGDGYITLYWDFMEYETAEELDAYLIWRDDNADGAFELLAEVPVGSYFDELTYRFIDQTVINGRDYEYAVSAIDAAGNESALSYEIVIDTPRPEGYNLELHDLNSAANLMLCGFDFSLLGQGRTDPTLPNTTADIFVFFEGGIPYVEVARSGVFLQDYGTFLDGNDVRLDWVDWAPEGGYSQTGRAELIFGHAYIVEILEPGSSELHYAKFAVGTIRNDSRQVVIDWAYQEVTGLPELKAAPDKTTVAFDFEPIKF